MFYFVSLVVHKFIMVTKKKEMMELNEIDEMTNLENEESVSL